MPCRYVIDQENRLVISTAWDRLTFADAKAHQDQLAIDPGFNPAFNQLDAAAVSTLEMTNDEAKSLVRRVIFARIPAGIRRDHRNDFRSRPIDGSAR